ncbi:MAG: 2'-5' RNA ligase family protein [Dehalococcoidales bacterium]|jgi:2'-5' RNA ligase
MLTNYATDTSRWENWQKEYKYGAIMIVPPDPPSVGIDILRRKYDPKAQAICGAHISITVPFPRALSDANWYELKSIAAGIKPFTVKYGPLMNFLPHPGVCLEIGPFETLEDLRATLEKASSFKGALPRKFPFRPHMTIAEFITVDRTKELTEKLNDATPSGSFFCTSISYYVPDNNFHFTERGRFDLA